MKLLIIRHGQTDANLAGVIQGCGIDLPLNETGIAQANELKEKLKAYKIDAIYHSNLQRAKQTAMIVNQEHSVEMTEIADLREVCFGDAEGMPADEAKKKYADLYKIFGDISHPLNKKVSLPNGESREQSICRAMNAIDRIAKEAKGQVIAVVTHGSLMFNIYEIYFNQGRRFVNCDFFEIEV